MLNLNQKRYQGFFATLRTLMGVLFLSFVQLQTHAQTPWTTMGTIPYSSGESVLNFEFVSSNEGFIITRQGGWNSRTYVVYTTTDEGLSWNKEFFESPENGIRGGYFVDATTGWLAGELKDDLGGVLYKTTDGGKTWTELYRLEEEYSDFTSVFFSKNNPDKGWMTGYGYSVLSTTDGGKTWDRQDLSLGGTVLPLARVFFVDEMHGWVYDSFNYDTHETFDGGKTWVRNDTGYDCDSYDYGCEYEEFRFSRENSQIGWIVTHSTRDAISDKNSLAITTDGGKTWKEVYIGLQRSDRYDIENVYFFDEKNAWANRDGALVYSQDGGISWKVKEEGFVGLKVFNKDHRWAIDSEGVLYKYDTSKEEQEIHFNLASEKVSLFYWGESVESFIEATASSGLSVSYESSNTAVMKVEDNKLKIVGVGTAVITATQEGDTEYFPALNIQLTVRVAEEEDNPDEYYKRIDFIGQTGWVVGSNGTILKTTNNGITWERQPNPFNISLEELSVVSEDVIWTRDILGNILHTTDGGKTWQPRKGQGKGFISFVNDKVGWTEGYSKHILKTVDGGITWERQIVNLNEELYFKNMVVLNEQEALLVGYDVYEDYDYIDVYTGTIKKTTDGGKTWKNFQRRDGIYTDLVIFDEGKGLILGGSVYSDRVFIEDFNGNVIFESQNSVLTGFDFANENVGYGINSLNNEVRQTLNGGYNWDVLETLPNRLYDIKVSSQGDAWVVGANRTLYRVSSFSDNCPELEIAHQKEIPLEDIFFVGEKGWAAGYEGTIYATQDGGTTWATQQSGLTTHLLDVYFYDENTGWAVGAYGKIVHTTDGGMTWTPQQSGLTGAYWLRDVYFATPGMGWIAGADGVILHTMDGGQTWTRQTSGTSKFLRDMYFQDAQKGWIVGSSGTILKTTNGGHNWTKIAIPYVEGLHAIQFTDAQTGWIAGSFGAILKTTDGGQTWIRQVIEGKPELYDLFFYNKNEGWAVGADGYLLETKDEGENWTRYCPDVNETITGVHFITPDQGWFAGKDGKIYAYQAPGSLQKTAQETVTVYAVPFENTLSVKLQDKTVGQVQLRLYDYQGNQILIQEAATEEEAFHLDTHIVKSGKYLLYIQWGDKVVTKQVEKR